MGKIRKAIHFMAGASILCTLSFCTYSFSTAETRMIETCNQISQGMPIYELKEFAVNNGLNPPHKESGITFLAEKKTFGRWACQVELLNGSVQSAKYHFAD